MCHVTSSRLVPSRVTSCLLMSDSVVSCRIVCYSSGKCGKHPCLTPPRSLKLHAEVAIHPPLLLHSSTVPLRHSHPRMVHVIESTGAVVDMDMSTGLMNMVLGVMGCDFHPLLITEEKSSERERLASLRFVWFCFGWKCHPARLRKEKRDGGGRRAVRFT